MINAKTALEGWLQGQGREMQKLDRRGRALYQKCTGGPTWTAHCRFGRLVASAQFDSFNCRIIAALDIALANTFGLRECRENEYRKNEKELVDCVQRRRHRFFRHTATWPLTFDGEQTELAPQGSLLVSDGETMRKIAMEGVGLARLTRFLVDEDIRQGITVGLGRSMCVCHKKGCPC
ncbi:hypothetical protein [Marinobacter salarius]|uniref:hypothetical protein n=1 Tax=Marinobacter salarius TaxID=1420917 RepID=UPI0018F20784|nr:hypothetical protein [Marinobacter salarius]MBJ7277857.1 hypothetical protein [Marinobacter salarius]